MKGSGCLAFAAFFAAAASGFGGDKPFESGVCLSRARIELGTFAAVQLYVKNVSGEDIVVGGPKVEIPQRYRTCQKLPDCSSPGPFVELKPGEIRFWSYPVPKDHGFTPLLLGRYEATVTYEVRWGEGRERFVGVPAGWEDKRVPPAPPEGREVFRVPISYEIVEPGEEMALMRQRYTKEIEACDLLQGGKQVMVQELDVSAADRDARDEVARSLGITPDALTDSRPPYDVRLQRKLAMYDHPRYLEAFSFRVHYGRDIGAGFDYDASLRYLNDLLAGRVGRAPGVDDFYTRTAGRYERENSYKINYAKTIARRQGPQTALAYLRSLDTSGFNCADRAFYNEFVERIQKAQAKKAEASEQAAPQNSKQ